MKNAYIDFDFAFPVACTGGATKDHKMKRRINHE
jgi:hypothetical protein